MNMKRYAKYHFLKSIILLPVMIFVGLLFTSSVVTTSWFAGNSYLSLSPLAFFIYGCAMIIPLVEFRDFTNKRNLDTIYSLPISRTSLFVVHYLTGLVYILAAYVCCSISCFIQISEVSGWSFGYFWPYCFMELLFAVALYSYMTLAMVIGNTLRDGFMLVIMYEYFPSLLLSTIASIIGRIMYGKDFWRQMQSIYEYTTYVAPTSVSLRLSLFYETAITENKFESYNYFGYVVFVIIGLASLFLAKYVFTHKKTVLIGEPTTSPLGFTTLIPATTLLLFINTYSGENSRIVGTFIALRLMLVAATYIAYALQYRSLKIGKKNLIILGVLGVLAVLPLDLGIA